MSLIAQTSVTCPACHATREVEVVQSLNTEQSPELEAKLLAGELNRFACPCGKRATVAGELLFVDPAARFWCRVSVADEAARAKAAEAFRVAGATGTMRVVPSLNALVEKVKLLRAGLEDWAIELMKVLLLASQGSQALNAVLLFESVDRDAKVLRWVRFDEAGQHPRTLTAPLGLYEGHLTEWKKVAPKEDEALVDRRWAVEALERLLPKPV